VAVLTDEHVGPLYRERLGLDAPVLTVPAGEGSKSFAVLERVLDFLASSRLDRRGVLVALGGGVVGDLGGLAASLYMRGISLVQCPTTLLSQVDSSVGGKTAVNLKAGKNLAGTFHQPSAVFADTSTLDTIEDEELGSGVGEVLKSALIGDAHLLELLERETSAVVRRDPGVLAEVVERSVRVKAAVVERDQHEAGERKKLNLGHTFAHAIEHVAGYGRVPHGIAVGVGLRLALEASSCQGWIEDGELVSRIEALLEGFDIPTSLHGLRDRYTVPLAAEDLVRAMRLDKKGAEGEPRFVLPRGIGSIELDRELAPELLVALLS